MAKHKKTVNVTKMVTKLLPKVCYDYVDRTCVCRETKKYRSF